MIDVQLRLFWTTYHVIGILENDKVIDQQVPAGNVLAAIESFETDSYFRMGRVTALRLPCQNEGLVALARKEIKEFIAETVTNAPKKMDRQRFPRPASLTKK